MHLLLSKKIQRSLLYIGTIFALLLSCHGPIMNLVEMHEHTANSSQETHCCDGAECHDQAVHCIDTSFTVESPVDFLGIFFAISFFVIAPFRDSASFFTQARLYVQAIRDRYGGFLLFNFLTGLYSQGILQPKLFA